MRGRPENFREAPRYNAPPREVSFVDHSRFSRAQTPEDYANHSRWRQQSMSPTPRIRNLGQTPPRFQSPAVPPRSPEQRTPRLQSPATPFRSPPGENVHTGTQAKPTVLSNSSRSKSPGTGNKYQQREKPEQVMLMEDSQPIPNEPLVKMPATRKTFLMTAKATTYDVTTHAYLGLPIIFDCASSRTYVEARTAEKLQLPTIRTDVFEYKHWGATEAIRAKSDVKELLVIGRSGEKVRIEATIAPQITNDPIPRPKLTDDDRKKVEYALAESQKRRQPVKPVIMLGVDQMWNFVVGESFPLTQGLHALPTIFGAVVSGIPETLMIVHEVQDPTRPPTTVEELEEAVEAIWTPDPDIKAAGASKELASKTNAEVTQEFKANITKKPDGYYVRFPWKGVPGDVPNNFGITIKRLLSNWEFLRKKPQILDKYHAIFMDQLEKGMIKTVDPRKPCEARVHYLPHQAVLTPEKATTKVRPVFDASAHLRGCPSLNDTMYQGPSLIPLILGIMLRIRTGRILLLADVEKAFLQIKLHTSERDAVRFILLKDPNKKPDRDNWVIYRYTCVPFGITASPFLLGATIEHHLRKTLHDEMFIKQLIQNTYVDNVILTVDNPEKAIEVARICKKVFSEASMNLREFMTNDKIVWHQIPVKNRSYLPGQKILGTTWDSETDGFRLHVKTNPPVKKTIIVACTVTRALTIEPVRSMSVQDFLMALRNVFARTMVPKTVTCDNAPTLIAGGEILDRVFQEACEAEDVVAFLAKRSIQWRFITPYSHWQGGFYERLIQDVKRTFHKATRHERSLNYDELRTVMLEIEAALNSRPLTYIEAEVSEAQVIRPIDFVYKGTTRAFPI
ncbi:hypothetical protein L596_001043 [Steinernema carpocapsae]|uniref:Integrase catalytic domain-containing protein n=1 Tax=Steinernema carpocapsae TaxID=34508 RepID=A0A4U8UK48_STECR|nr:hypothetical protein L596_001043 [Steinernema carpocapsae]